MWGFGNIRGENLWLCIHEDTTWEFVNDQDDVIEYGTLWVDENGVTLHFDGSGDTLQLDRTVSWQGNSYLIEFAYSTDWQYNVGDWAQVFTKSYKDTAKRMQLDSISPEAAVMDIDTVDPYSSMYFSLYY